MVRVMFAFKMITDTLNVTPISISTSFYICIFHYYNHLRTIYNPKKNQTTHQSSTLTSFSHPGPRPSTTTNHLPLSILFDPLRWNKYFYIPAHAPYSKHIFQFQNCIQRQVGRVTIHTRLDKSHLLIVDSESQAEAMSILKDLDRKPFLVFPDTQLNTCTCIVHIPNEICPVAKLFF